MGKIIVMFENKDKELNMSLYDFIDEQYRKANPIMVCHVTEEEYSNMKKQVKSGCLNERFSVKYKNETERGYNKFRYVVTYDSFENNLLISDYNNPKKIGSYVIDTNGIHYNENGFQITNHPYPYSFTSCGSKVYTTETYEDIVSHYKLQQDIEYKIQEKTKELIELIGKSCKTCNSECCGGPGGKACSRWSHIIR